MVDKEKLSIRNTEEHRRLVAVLKGVHADLRKKLRQSNGDFDAVWSQHCKDQEMLALYAKSMKQLAEDHWTKRSKTRIEWCRDTINEYYHGGGLKKVLEKEMKRKLLTQQQQERKFYLRGGENVLEKSDCQDAWLRAHATSGRHVGDQKTSDKQKLDSEDNDQAESGGSASISVSAHRWIPVKGQRLRLLDVGSCYNPFLHCHEFLAVGLDLSPACQSVHQCDFLRLCVTEELRSGGVDLQKTSEPPVKEDVAAAMDKALEMLRSPTEVEPAQPRGVRYSARKVEEEVSDRVLESVTSSIRGVPVQTRGTEEIFGMGTVPKEKEEINKALESLSSPVESLPACIRGSRKSQMKEDEEIEKALESLSSPVESLPAQTFHAVVFSLLLEYLPDPLPRFLCCVQAHRLLRPHGLLVIVTPDSHRQHRNAPMMRSWRTAIETLGFSRWRYVKQEHLHCMAFRKLDEHHPPYHHNRPPTNPVSPSTPDTTVYSCPRPFTSQLHRLDSSTEQATGGRQGLVQHDRSGEKSISPESISVGEGDSVGSEAFREKLAGTTRSSAEGQASHQQDPTQLGECHHLESESLRAHAFLRFKALGVESTSNASSAEGQASHMQDPAVHEVDKEYGQHCLLSDGLEELALGSEAPVENLTSTGSLGEDWASTASSEDGKTPNLQDSDHDQYRSEKKNLATSECIEEHAVGTKASKDSWTTSSGGFSREFLDSAFVLRFSAMMYIHQDFSCLGGEEEEEEEQGFAGEEERQDFFTLTDSELPGFVGGDED